MIRAIRLDNKKRVCNSFQMLRVTTNQKKTATKSPEANRTISIFAEVAYEARRARRNLKKMAAWRLTTWPEARAALPNACRHVDDDRTAITLKN